MSKQSVLSDQYVADARASLKAVGDRYGIDLLAAADRAEKQQEDIGTAVRAVLYPALLKEMNISPPGNAPQEHEAIKAALQEAKDSSVGIFVNASFNQDQFLPIQDKTGSDISEFVSGLKSALQLTLRKDMTALEIATTIGGTVLLGGLGPVFYYASQASWDAAATWISRLAFGIGEIGVASWCALAAVIVVEVGIYLMNVQANFMGVIVNNSDEEFAVQNWRKGVDDGKSHGLYLNHGKIVGFMVADLTKIHSGDETQLGNIQTTQVGSQTITMMSLGLFYATKRDSALVGCEGAMVFKPKNNPSSSPSIALAYSCPYSGNNGVSVSLTNDDQPANQFWNKVSPTLGISSTSVLSGFSAVAKVNSQSGPDASCIVTVNGSWG